MEHGGNGAAPQGFGTPTPSSPPAASPERPLFDPEALFRDPEPEPQVIHVPADDKVNLTPKLLIGIVVVLALLGGAVYWAMGFAKSPAPLAAASGTTVPPATAPLVPPAPPTPAGFVNRTATGVSIDLPTDCSLDRLPTNRLVAALGTEGDVLYSCATPEPTRLVMVATLTNTTENPGDPALDKRLAAGRALAAHFEGTGATLDVQDHLVMGRPGVLVNVTLPPEDGHDAYDTIALGVNAKNEKFMIITGGIDQPWPQGVQVIDSAR